MLIRVTPFVICAVTYMHYNTMAIIFGVLLFLLLISKKIYKLFLNMLAPLSIVYSKTLKHRWDKATYISQVSKHTCINGTSFSQSSPLQFNNTSPCPLHFSLFPKTDLRFRRNPTLNSFLCSFPEPLSNLITKNSLCWHRKIHFAAGRLRDLQAL